MTNENRGPALVRDDELTKELRVAFAPPADEAYWTALEQRIMARIDAGVWWSVPERWLRVGLVAAGITVIIAGSLLLRTQSQVSRMAYEVAIDSAATDNLEVARRDRLTEEQETLRRLTGRR